MSEKVACKPKTTKKAKKHTQKLSNINTQENMRPPKHIGDLCQKTPKILKEKKARKSGKPELTKDNKKEIPEFFSKKSKGTGLMASKENKKNKQKKGAEKKA